MFSHVAIHSLFTIIYDMVELIILVLFFLCWETKFSEGEKSTYFKTMSIKPLRS